MAMPLSVLYVGNEAGVEVGGTPDGEIEGVVVALPDNCCANDVVIGEAMFWPAVDETRLTSVGAEFEDALAMGTAVGSRLGTAQSVGERATSATVESPVRSSSLVPRNAASTCLRA